MDRGELDKLIDRKGRYYADGDYEDDDFGEEGGRQSRERARERQETRPQKKRGFFQNLMESFGEGGMDD